MKLKSFSVALLALTFLSSSLHANDEKIWNALRTGFLPWAIEMITANPKAVNYDFPVGAQQNILYWLKRYDVIREPQPVTQDEQQVFARMITGDLAVFGTWQIFVDEFSHQHINAIFQICGPRSLEHASEKDGRLSYIVRTDRYRISELKEKGWILRARQLPE